MKRILFVVVAVTFAACNNGSSTAATQDPVKQAMDTQRKEAGDSVSMKSAINERTIDSSFKVLKDSIQKIK